MLIAAACNANNEKAVITQRYGEAEYILVFETDNDSLVKEYKRAETPAAVLAGVFDEMFVECIVCGIMEREEFEPIAGMQITRYNGAGLNVLEAVHASEDNCLPLITDFEGGTGCDDRHEEERVCTGDCAACDLEETELCEESKRTVH